MKATTEVVGLLLYAKLRLPEERYESVYVWLVIHIFNADCPGMPVERAIRFRAWEVHGIEISLIGPLRFIGRAAVFEFITMKRIRLVKGLHQFRHNHSME